MKSALLDIGLSEKEARFYLFLLEEGNMTAADIAKRLKESRTNTYMVLEKLVSENLIEVDESAPIRRYRAADPTVLKSRITQRMQQIKQSNASLSAALPDMMSLFSLGQHKPGVTYMEGINGFKALLEDNARLKKGTIDLLASSKAPDNHEAWQLLQKGIAKRSARGIKTRGLFTVRDQKEALVKEFAGASYEIRFWGQELLPGEIVIYGGKVAFTVYEPSLIVTIITNDVLAQTFRVIFDQLWQTAGV